MASGETATISPATATAAAAATATKNRPSPLPTPVTGAYPSSLHSPALSTPGYLRREDALKTPLTPPTAYLDFLKSIPASLASPPSTSASLSFSTGIRSPRIPHSTDNRFPYPQPPATARPALPSHSSSDSASSSSETTTRTSASAPEPVVANSSRPLSKPASPRPARAASVSSGQPQRRPSLLIPESPSFPTCRSPGSAMSPSSAKYMYAPWSARSPHSAATSPIDREGAGKTRNVSVRHVILRTVTYATAASPSSMRPPTSGLPTDPQAAAKPAEATSAPQTERAEKHTVDTVVTPSLSSPSKRSPLVGEAPRGKRRKIEVKEEETVS